MSEQHLCTIVLLLSSQKGALSESGCDFQSRGRGRDAVMLPYMSMSLLSFFDTFPDAFHLCESSETLVQG